MSNLTTPWQAARERAGIENVRIHDCRHSFVSRAHVLGESLPAIGKLRAQGQIQTTTSEGPVAKHDNSDTWLLPPLARLEV